MWFREEQRPVKGSFLFSLLCCQNRLFAYDPPWQFPRIAGTLSHFIVEITQNCHSRVTIGTVQGHSQPSCLRVGALELRPSRRANWFTTVECPSGVPAGAGRGPAAAS